MKFIKISVREAAKAFEASGREARTSQAQRTVREIAKGDLGLALAVNAFAHCGKMMVSALDGHLDFSPATLSIYASGDGRHACRMATMTAEGTDQDALLAKNTAETLSANGDERAAQAFHRHVEKKANADACAIVEALVYGARHVVAERQFDAGLNAA